MSGIKTYMQYQMIRHGVDFGAGAVAGSSLNDKFNDDYAAKYFLMDGVYRWENVIRLGGSYNIKGGAIPAAVYAETGLVITRFTVNGKAGVGHEADYDEARDSVYRGGNRLILSFGFRLFPNS